MGLLRETTPGRAQEQEDRRLAACILREAERAAPPGTDAAGALEEILRDRRAGAAFVLLYADEILQFWEGHCCETEPNEPL
ncbi:MAG TPA: hypothetical protein H9915_00640 [Candidatus Gemmiger faecigallinarum]|nr:hypothetical protein [Candidatus Gemmiger faecigallinarum]